MKLQRNLPTNGDFFDRYAELITSLSSVATIAQIITGACEIGILYGLIHPSFVDIVPPQYVGIISMIGAVICAILLQIGLKKVYPHAIRSILHKHFKGLYLWFSIFIFILTLAMLTASITLSWQGSKDIADFVVSKPIEKTTSRSDSTKNADFLTAQRLFASDSATIETKYKGKLEATESEKMSEINAVERNSKGKQATSLRAELKTKLAKLQADKAAEIEVKATERKRLMDKASDRNDGDAATIATDNTTAKHEAATKKDRYKGYIGYFTLMCYVFFLSVFTMNEIYHKGANIEIKPLPSQRHFNPSVFAEFVETVKEKLDVYFRTKIQNWADKTPSQPIPLSMSALYDFKADFLTDTVKIETVGKETEVIKLPLKMPRTAKVAADNEPDNQSERPQRKIGFFGKNAASENDVNAHTASVYTASVGDKTKTCLHCGKSYIYSIHNQKFCCENCRVAAFEARTGKKLRKQPKK
jgi:ribosomal protein S27AE